MFPLLADIKTKPDRACAELCSVTICTTTAAQWFVKPRQVHCRHLAYFHTICATHDAARATVPRKAFIKLWLHFDAHHLNSWRFLFSILSSCTFYANVIHVLNISMVWVIITLFSTGPFIANYGITYFSSYLKICRRRQHWFSILSLVGLHFILMNYL